MVRWTWVMRTRVRCILYCIDLISQHCLRRRKSPVIVTRINICIYELIRAAVSQQGLIRVFRRKSFDRKNEPRRAAPKYIKPLMYDVTVFCHRVKSAWNPLIPLDVYNMTILSIVTVRILCAATLGQQQHNIRKQQLLGVCVMRLPPDKFGGKTMMTVARVRQNALLRVYAKHHLQPASRKATGGHLFFISPPTL